MFGMGFTEILLIAVMAIIFVGPDKLPGMMIDIVKFFRNVKNTVGSVKETFEEEINVSDIKKEALAYKQELLNATEDLNQVTHIKDDIASGLSDLNSDILSLDDDTKQESKKEKKPQEVTLKKKKKNKIKTEKEDELNA